MFETLQQRVLTGARRLRFSNAMAACIHDSILLAAKSDARAKEILRGIIVSVRRSHRWKSIDTMFWNIVLLVQHLHSYHLRIATQNTNTDGFLNS